MDQQLSFEARGQYLVARVSAPYDPAILRELFTAVRAKALERKFTRVLIDGTGVSLPSAEVNRYLVGETFADLFPPPFKVAALYPRMTDKFTENTAAIRGTDILICTDETEAVRWLLADVSGTPDDVTGTSGLDNASTSQ